MNKPLDPIIHSELRLAIISLLISVDEADFNLLLFKTNSTAGNLSVQLSKLEAAGYISIEKTFKNKRPNTICKITENGIKAFEEYVKILKGYLNL